MAVYVKGKVAKVAGCLALCLIPASLSAAVFTTSLHNYAVDRSGEFTSAEFDFGVQFQRIDQVRLELIAPYALSNVSTGSTHYYSSILVDLFGRGAEPEFDPALGLVTVGNQSHPTTLRAGFGFLDANQPVETSFWPPGSRFDAESGLIAGRWPDFLLAGRGDARLQRIDGFYFYMNGTGSGQTIRSPESLTSVRLTIEGVAIPEPAALPLAAAAVVLCSHVYRQSRRVLTL